jgi:predicted RNA-binding Zn-ribbon protein involved in translation (DUF1610 family)
MVGAMRVACPSCGAAQDAQSTGYTCTSCGAAWAFATCDRCGARFHMRPGTTQWTCPDCGAEHGVTVMGELAPDDGAAPTEPAPAEPAPVEPTPERPTTTPAEPRPPGATTTPAGPRGGGRPTRAKLALIAVGGIAVVLATAFGLSALGGNDGAAEPRTSVSASAAPSPTLDLTQTLCLHMRDLQTPREDALARLADELQGDADAFRAAGDATVAAKVVRLRTAVLAYRDALASHADLTTVSADLGKAVSALPC